MCRPFHRGVMCGSAHRDSSELILVLFIRSLASRLCKEGRDRKGGKMPCHTGRKNAVSSGTVMLFDAADTRARCHVSIQGTR